jgi:hypothetical protein
MVEPASPTAGVDIRRDYALGRRRLSCGCELGVAHAACQPYSAQQAAEAIPANHRQLL